MPLVYLHMDSVKKSGDFELQEALSILTDEYIQAGNVTEQTVIDLRDALKSLLAGKFSVIRHDNDAHEFLIPVEMAANFDKDRKALDDARSEEELWAAEDIFNANWWSYRCDGGRDLLIVRPS